MKRDVQLILEDKRVKLTKRPKIGQNGQMLNILEFSRHSECDFFKENYMNNLHNKIRKIHRGVLEVIGKKTLKTINFGQKRPKFGLKWAKFCHITIFLAYRV